MEEKKIYLKSDSKTNTNTNRLKLGELNSTINNFTLNVKKSKTKLDFSKIKINRDILSSIIKTSNIKKLQKKNRTQTKLHYFHNIKNDFNKDMKISTDLNEKFKDLPGISKYRNITGEKINDLLKSSNEDNSNKSFFFRTNVNYKKQRKSHKVSHRNQTAFLNKYLTEKKDTMETLKNNNRYQNRNNSSNDNKLLIKLSLDSKKFNLKLKELKNKQINNLYYLKTPILNFQKNNETFFKKRNEYKNNNKEVINRMKLNSFINKRVNKSFTKRWLKSLRDFIRNYDFCDKEIKKENHLVYFIEKPLRDEIKREDEDEDENEYLIFKEKIMKHKDMFEKFLRKIKMDQMNQDYLMKKYIYELLTNKNKLE